ncbi:MAG: F0F1 ATP synthase subunit B [Gammaproteobacteria bacterium]|nr:F0F1 ATP synthase subunit B [Gammaproteobacteria bacterium]
MNITVTLFAQMAAFIMLIIFVNKLLWGPMNAMLAERQKRISDGLAAAEKGKHELELSEKRAKEALVEAKNRASEIIAQAEKRASEIIDGAKTEARAEGGRLVAAAKAEIDQEVNRAKEQLRKQVAGIAAAGAGKILGREIDANKHDDLLKDLVAQI